MGLHWHRMLTICFVKLLESPMARTTENNTGALLPSEASGMYSEVMTHAYTPTPTQQTSTMAFR